MMRCSPEWAETRACVNRSAPGVRETKPFELRKCVEEMLSQSCKGSRVIFQMSAKTIIPIIDCIVTAPENTSIWGCARVMELPARIADTLTPVPSNGFSLRGRQRLRDQCIIINRDNIIRESFEQGRKGIRCECNACGAHTSMFCKRDHVIIFFFQFVD